MERVKRTGRVARVVAIGVALLTLGAAAPVAVAQVCQVPLFVQESNVEANVMFLFDNSGSMNHVIHHPEYNHDVTWAGGYSSGSTYYISKSGWVTQNGVSAYLVASDKTSARYWGNYLNWVFWHATEEQRLSIPQVTRIQVAKEVVLDIITRTEGIRLGLTVFNGDKGGNIIGKCGVNPVSLCAQVEGIVANSWTPLGESMETLLNYFVSDTSGDAIQYHCQQNFIIVMTDGFPTQDRDVSLYLWDADGDGHDPGTCTSMGAPDPDSYNCSDHMDDIAYYMRHTDLRDDLGRPGESWEDGQNVVTYAVGFGIDAAILEDTAINGDGLYLLAMDAAELWLSLELIMLDVISRISSGAAVAVVSTERGTDDRLFRGKFMPGEWTGFLEAFDLPYEIGSPAIWEAGYTLSNRAANDRDIFTAIGANRYDFVTGQAGNLSTAMGVADAAIAADLIAWTRGEDVAPYRDRGGWKLGDIIHSTPVVIGSPADFRVDEDYMSFMAANANRTKMVYVGGNDGMLHAFYVSSGHEAWAFIPEFALPKLQEIAAPFYCHTYSVDQTSAVQDVKLHGVWRTVLVCGGRQGGAGYFALDVTAPASPQVLWQIELPNHMAFSSEAEFATIDGQEVVLIGSGLDEVNGEAFLYEYSVETGALLGTLKLSDRGLERNKATAPRVVDLEFDGESDIGYIGDLAGNVWRVKFNASTNSASWDVSALYSGEQEITATPVPGFGEAGAVYVYFGTGAYLDLDDISTEENQTFYCVYDRHDGAEHPSLVDQTGSIDDVGSDDGWYIELEEAVGERITEPASVVAGTVFFTSFTPSNEPCSAGGMSWLYRVRYEDGGLPDDGEEDDFAGSRIMDLDDGIASRAGVDVMNEAVIVQSSDATITVQEIGEIYFHLTVRSWQESYDHVMEPSVPVEDPPTP
jgi:type IV pilus assembly protein PilY1